MSLFVSSFFVVESKLVVLEACVWKAPVICPCGGKVPRSVALHGKRRAGIVAIWACKNAWGSVLYTIECFI